MFFGILLYCRFSTSPEVENCTKLPSLSSFEGFSPYLSKAKSTLVLEALENWSYEMVAMMSGYLILSQQAAMTIDYTITYLIVYVPWGFYNSNVTLVGGALGERNISKAKKIFKITFYLCVVVIIAFVAVTIALSE